MDSALKTAVVAVLSPIVRYLIRQGWTCPALCETIKAIYVAEVVRPYTKGPEKTSTDSRISLLTGIHRKDVKRLREELAQGIPAPTLRRGANLAARVVGAWVSTPRYLNEDGTPKVLPLRDKVNPCFEELVREAKADMRPKAVIDELIRTGVAETDIEGNIKLLRTAYISALPKDKLAFLGDNVSDHLKGAIHNISTPQSPFLERAVYYECIPSEGLNALRGQLFRLGDQMLRQANEKLMPLEKENQLPLQEPHSRVRLGVYYYEEEYQQPPLQGIIDEEENDAESPEDH